MIDSTDLDRYVFAEFRGGVGVMAVRSGPTSMLVLPGERDLEAAVGGRRT